MRVTSDDSSNRRSYSFRGLVSLIGREARTRQRAARGLHVDHRRRWLRIRSAAAAAAAAPKKGAGFSASLTAELAKDGSGGGAQAVRPEAPTAPDPKAATPDPKAAAPGTEAARAATRRRHRTSDPKAPIDPKVLGTKDDGNHNSVPEPIVSHEPGPSRPSPTRAHVDPGPALRAIKLDMEPNWDRDYETAGTLSFVLKVPNTTDTRLFSFHYGYDLAGAPDRSRGVQEVSRRSQDPQRHARSPARRGLVPRRH